MREAVADKGANQGLCGFSPRCPVSWPLRR
jgi:hypothetical protein